MPLSPDDKEQVRNAGLLTAVAVAFVIMAPLPEQGIGIKGLLAAKKTEERLLKTEEEGLRDEELRIDRIPAIERELQEREPEIQKYEARLPKNRDVPELYKDIDRFKQQSGLDIVVQTRLEPVDKEDYLDLPIRVEARGDYDSIATFINYLERNQRFAKVKELEVTEIPGENSEEEGTPEDLATHDAAMTVSTFMFLTKPKQEKKEGEETAKETTKKKEG
jgi:type IV pilus assembly protein PilO